MGRGHGVIRGEAGLRSGRWEGKKIWGMSNGMEVQDEERPEVGMTPE